MEPSTIIVRPATRDDAEAITRIYNEGIRGRGATFETRERTPTTSSSGSTIRAFRSWWRCDGGVVVGWAAASAYRARECYAGIAEYSIYVAIEPSRTGQSATC